VDCRTNVPQFRDVKPRTMQPYPIGRLQEVDYGEMAELAKIDEGRDEFEGYRKLLDNCELAGKKDGSEWLWLDTFCVDKRSSSTGTGGTRTREYAMTSLARPYPL